MLLMVEEQDSACSRLNPALFFSLKDIAFKHTTYQAIESDTGRMSIK